MAIEVKVPRLGWSMEEGTFIEWLKREGQPVQAGEPLFAIEGDKAIQEVEAIGSGILRIPSTAPENGETVKVGQTLAFLVAEEDAATFNSALAVSPEPAAVSLPESDEGPSSTTADPIAATATDNLWSNRPRISPRALRVAAELGVHWESIPGTGRNGRIRERDVREAEATTIETVYALPPDLHELAEPAEPPRRKRRVRRSDETSGSATPSSFRRTIAARMLQGSQATAPVTLTTTADATNLTSLRAQFKATAQSTNPSADGRVPGYTDFLVKLVARALQEHAPLNRQWINGQIVSPEGIHIAIAVDTPAGLLAPVLRDVPGLGLREIAARTHDLKLRAHSSQLEARELTGGTFTISNLGAFGIDAFTPIINVPQCAILGLGRIERRPAVVGDQIVPRETLTLSLTFDHRIVDGAPAARFLAAVRSAIENPGPWLVF